MYLTIDREEMEPYKRKAVRDYIHENYGIFISDNALFDVIGSDTNDDELKVSFNTTAEQRELIENAKNS